MEELRGRKSFAKKTFVIALAIVISLTITKVTFLLYLFILNIPFTLFSWELPNSPSVIIGTLISLFAGILCYVKTYKFLGRETKNI